MNTVNFLELWVGFFWSKTFLIVAHQEGHIFFASRVFRL